MLDDEQKKKKGNTIEIIICVVIAVVLGTVGFFLGGMLKECVKCDTKEEKKEEIKPVEEKEPIPYKDKVVYGTYGEKFILYMIDDGAVYFKTSASLFAGLNVCPSEEEYCKTNPTYNNDMSKIDGLENVKRIKYVTDLNASDESFIVYAITENGDVYTLSGSTATKTELTNIEDLVNVYPSKGYYEFSTKDGKTIEEKAQGGATTE